MRYYFFDSSTFLKLFVVEPGDKRVREIVTVAQTDRTRVTVSICDLAHPECVSAMRQMMEKGAGGRRGISSATLRQLLPRIATTASPESVFTIVRTSSVIRESADLAARLRVKGADAVHIAAARRVHGRVAQGDEFWFVSADLRQIAAARQEGMSVLDPTA